MIVTKVVDAGKLTGSYLSSWKNELQLTVEGGTINIICPEAELRDLANRVNERLGTIDADRQEELDAEIRAAAEELESEVSDG